MWVCLVVNAPRKAVLTITGGVCLVGTETSRMDAYCSDTPRSHENALYGVLVFCKGIPTCSPLWRFLGVFMWHLVGCRLTAYLSMRYRDSALRVHTSR